MVALEENVQVAYSVHELILPIRGVADEPTGQGHPLDTIEHGLKHLPGVLEVWLSPKGDYLLLDVDGNHCDVEQVIGFLEEKGLVVGERQLTVMKFSDWS